MALVLTRGTGSVLAGATEVQVRARSELQSPKSAHTTWDRRALSGSCRPHGCLLHRPPPVLLGPTWWRQVPLSSVRQRVVVRGERAPGGRTGVAEKQAEVVDDNSVAGRGPEDVQNGKETRNGVAEGAGGVSLGLLSQGLSGIPERYKTVLMTSLAFVICNMDKVNMSVAIVPISHQYNWSATTAGLVQSSFFWGYAISQMPGGWLASRLTGKRVLAGGVFVWSVATALVPFTAGYLPGLYLCRLLVGLGEGVSPPAATDLVAKTVPAEERARAVATVFGGLNVGSVAGLIVAPVLIESLGWESVFYLFGLAGIAWCVAYDKQQPVLPEDPLAGQPSGAKQSGVRGSLRSLKRRVAALPEATKAEIQRDKERLEASSSGSDTDSDKETHGGHAAAGHGGTMGSPDGKSVPWRAFFQRPPLWAMMYVQFAGSWGHFTLLAWLPTYFSEVLKMDLTQAALVSILPPLASVLMSSVSAPWVDRLVASGKPVTQVRKLCQTVAFSGPATCMLVTSLNPDLPSWAVIGVLTAGLSLGSFSLSGLYCTHQDISPKYASVLSGITSTVGAIPGIVGVALTGYIFDETDSWKLALFFPSIFFYITGIVVWNVWHSSKPQDFDAMARAAE